MSEQVRKTVIVGLQTQWGGNPYQITVQERVFGLLPSTAVVTGSNFGKLSDRGLGTIELDGTVRPDNLLETLRNYQLTGAEFDHLAIAAITLADSKFFSN